MDVDVVLEKKNSCRNRKIVERCPPVEKPVSGTGLTTFVEGF
jgi:hypothetical protein